MAQVQRRPRKVKRPERRHRQKRAKKHDRRNAHRRGGCRGSVSHPAQAPFIPHQLLNAPPFREENPAWSGRSPALCSRRTGNVTRTQLPERKAESCGRPGACTAETGRTPHTPTMTRTGGHTVCKAGTFPTVLPLWPPHC